MAQTTVTWPLLVNVIRGKKKNNTFGMVRNGGLKPHQGWDFAAKVGAAAYAIADGTVEFVEAGGDYGNRVAITFFHKAKTGRSPLGHPRRPARFEWC